MTDRPPPPNYDPKTQIAVWNRYSQTWSVKPKVQQKPPPPIRKEAIKEYHDPRKEKTLPKKSEEQLLESIQKVHGDELEEKGIIVSTKDQKETGTRVIKKEGERTTIRTYQSGLVSVESPAGTQYYQMQEGIRPQDVEIPGTGIISYKTQRYLQQKDTPVFKGTLLDALESGRLGRAVPSFVSMDTFKRSGLDIEKKIDGPSIYEYIKGKRTVQYKKTTTETIGPTRDFYAWGKAVEFTNRLKDAVKEKIPDKAKEASMDLWYNIKQDYRKVDTFLKEKVTHKLIKPEAPQYFISSRDKITGSYKKSYLETYSSIKKYSQLEQPSYFDKKTGRLFKITQKMGEGYLKGMKSPFVKYAGGFIASPIGITGGILKEMREKPAKIVTTAGVFFLAGPVFGKAGRVLAPLAKMFPKTTTALKVALPLTYGGSVAVRSGVSVRPDVKLGRIIGGEVGPMLAGAYVGSKFWTALDFYQTKMIYESQFRSAQKMVRTDVLLGKTNFPTAQPKYQYKMFIGQKEYVLPYEKGTGITAMYHATPEKFPMFTLTEAGTSEIPGLYGSTELSMYFFKLGGGSVSIYGGDIFQGPGSPRGIRQEVLGFKKIPKGLKGKISQFMLNEAEVGYAYVAPTGKTEIEAVLTPRSISDLVDVPYYTKVPSPKQAMKYEFFKRRGTTEAIKRIKKFSWKKPSTYWDRVFHQALKGKKAGQFKQFNIRRGKSVLIERRITGGDKKIDLRKLLSGKSLPATELSGSYSYGQKYLISPSYLGLSSALSMRSSKKMSRVSEKLMSSKSYKKSSQRISRKSSSIISRLIYRPSYREYKYSSSGLSYRNRYRYSYSRISSGSYRRLSRYSSMLSSRSLSRRSYRGVSRGYSKRYRSYTEYNPSREPPPSIILGIFSRPIKKSKPHGKLKPLAVYNPSLMAVDRWIKGVKPKILTGIRLRPLIR